MIGGLERKPAVMGHSTGGLLAQMIAGRGLSAATVAIDPGPFRGVLPLPISALRSAWPVLKNPLNRSRAITLTFEQFRYGWANALSEEEAEAVRGVPRGGAGQGADADGERQPEPGTEARADPEPRSRPAADHRRREGPHGAVGDRERSVQGQRRNPGVTEIEKIPNRGHSLTIDSGWREVAGRALAFVKRFV